MGSRAKRHHNLRVISKDPMTEWGLYVLALLILIGVSIKLRLFESIWKDQTHLSLIILIVFAVAFVKNFLDVRFIRRELNLANSQTGGIKALIGTENVNGSFGRFLAEEEPSLLARHVSALYDIAQRTPNVSQDNLIVLLQAKLKSRLRIVDFASSILVTLGLIGTILGLIIAAGGVLV